MNSPTMQTMATIALLFAIYKRDPLHKDYFILFWLLISSYHSSTWCGMGFQYIHDDFYIYRFFEFIGSLLLLVGIWLVAGKFTNLIDISVYLYIWKSISSVIIGYLVYLIYQDYCELIQSNLNTLRIQASNSIPQMVETKEMPPPYAVPISENSSVCHIEPHN